MKIENNAPTATDNIEQPPIEQQGCALSPWLKQWMEEMDGHVNRMSKDENYRKQVAKYLS